MFSAVLSASPSSYPHQMCGRSNWPPVPGAYPVTLFSLFKSVRNGGCGELCCQTKGSCSKVYIELNVQPLPFAWEAGQVPEWSAFPSCHSYFEITSHPTASIWDGLSISRYTQKNYTKTLSKYVLGIISMTRYFFVLIYHYVSFMIYNNIFFLYSQAPSIPIPLTSKYSEAVERKLD